MKLLDITEMNDNKYVRKYVRLKVRRQKSSTIISQNLAHRCQLGRWR